MRKLLTVIIPIILIVVWGVALQITLGKMEAGFLRSFLAAGTGIIFSIFLVKVVIKLFEKNKLQKPLIGNLRGFFIGLFVGITVSAFSGFLFQLVFSQSPDLSHFFSNYFNRLLGNITPAATEEIAFRFSLVHMISSLYNPAAAMLAGSVPFGLIHLIGRFFGQEVGPMHVIAVSLAGLLLSLVYLRYGLLAAIGCHLMWNSLSIQWVEAYALDLKSGSIKFESASTTIAVLIVVNIFLFLSQRYNLKTHVL